MLRNFKWEVLEHPPYSTDLAPSDFHLFGPLKHHFPDDEAVEREVTAWFRQQSKEFYAAGFQGLVKGWTSASMYREIMSRKKDIFQICTLICLSSISICILFIDLPTYFQLCGLYFPTL
jgi:hypothetical protein